MNAPASIPLDVTPTTALDDMRARHDADMRMRDAYEAQIAALQDLVTLLRERDVTVTAQRDAERAKCAALVEAFYAGDNGAFRRAERGEVVT